MMIKLRSLHLNVVTMLSFCCFLVGIILGFIAFDSVVIVVNAFSKILFALSFLSIVIAVILFFVRKKVKVTEVK